MTPGSIQRDFWRYTIPTVMALMISGLYQIVDGIFIGHAMGAEGLAAINMAWPLAGVLLATGMMIGVGAGAHCSIALGAGNPGRATRVLGQVALLLLLPGLLAGWFIGSGARGFLALQGADADIQALGNDYLQVMARAAPLIMGSIAMPFLVRNLGAPRLATAAMISGALTNIALDYLFVMHWHWGLRGAALATVCGETLSFLICLVYVLRGRHAVPLRLAALRPVPRLWFEISATGLSSMLMYLYISFVVVLHNALFMAHGSALHVAAYAMAGYLLGFYYMFAEGVAGGMQPLVSYFYGARQAAPIRAVLRLALLTALGAGLLFTTLIIAWPGLFAAVFGADDAVLLDKAVVGLRLHLFALSLDGFLVLAAGFFQAMGMARQATLITLGNMLVQLPFLFGLSAVLGVTGVWLAVPLSNICLSLVVLVFLLRQLRRLSSQLGQG